MADEGAKPGRGGERAVSSPEFTPIPTPKHFHLHLVSDASGETLTTMAKAAVVQLAGAKPNRHMHPLVRNPKQLATVLQHIETAPGIVLYTLMNPNLAELLEARCAELERALRRGAEAGFSGLRELSEDARRALLSQASTRSTPNTSAGSRP